MGSILTRSMSNRRQNWAKERSICLKPWNCSTIKRSRRSSRCPDSLTRWVTRRWQRKPSNRVRLQSNYKIGSGGKSSKSLPISRLKISSKLSGLWVTKSYKASWSLASSSEWSDNKIGRSLINNRMNLFKIYPNPICWIWRKNSIVLCRINWIKKRNKRVQKCQESKGTSNG